MYKVEVKNRGGSEFLVKSEDGSITINSEGGAISPLDTLLSSLGACIGVYIKNYAKGAGITMDLFTVNLEAELSKNRGYYFKDINVSIDLNGSVIDDMKKKSLLEFVKNCPVHMTLQNEPSINIKIL